jgi:predicted dehydrogenase
MTGVGVIGLGFMGATHVRAIAAAAHTRNCRLIAVFDRGAGKTVKSPDHDSQASLTSNQVEIAENVRMEATALDVLSADDVDAVHVCTHTDSHVELALAALHHGKHVLVEKPVALRVDDVERLAHAAVTSRLRCMPAMCMRFWPGWSWLKQRVDAGDLGAVRSAVFRRTTTAPTWGHHFYADLQRCGGALFDLHVHDVDLIYWLFGDPTAVSAHGTRRHLTAAYEFEAGPDHVTAEASWDRAAGSQFFMGYEVEFEHATAQFDLHRDSSLQVASDGRIEDVSLDDRSGYELEVAHFHDAIADPAMALGATIADAVMTTRVLEAEARSLDSGQRVTI